MIWRRLVWAAAFAIAALILGALGHVALTNLAARDGPGLPERGRATCAWCHG